MTLLPRFQFTVGQMMSLVAACALAQAIAIAGYGIVGLLLLALGGAVEILARAGGMTRVRAAAWVFSAYPLVLAIIVMVRLVGLFAGPGAGDWWDAEATNHLMRGFVLGILPALWLSWGCSFAEWARATSGGRDGTRSVVGLLLFALLPWPAIIGLVVLLNFVLNRIRFA